MLKLIILNILRHTKTDAIIPYYKYCGTVGGVQIYSISVINQSILLKIQFLFLLLRLND